MVLGREDTFKPTVVNHNLHNVSNDSVIRVVHFIALKSLNFKDNVCTSQNS